MSNFRIPCSRSTIYEPLGHSLLPNSRSMLAIDAFKFSCGTEIKERDVNEWKNLTGFKIEDCAGGKHIIHVPKLHTYLGFDNHYEMSLFKLYFKI